MGTDTKNSFDLSARMEVLEDRLAMSADPLGGLLGGPIELHSIVEEPPAITHHQDHSLESTPDFWIDTSDKILLEDQLREIDQALAGAHDQTGLTTVRTDFGFTGIGQTVAVIDSGIAYDHIALGGGFGSSYRVVGGWDFTGENDANPYDDGPSGSHGTHVSGIIGADAGSNTGVAPGVDLVGLRVFDDSGAGYFSWVENALQWVHTNRNNYENPITAVNLSLGTSWNADTIPSWAMLEDEFAQLEADGIFIAVSAGNSFTSYNASGLSYPAVSSHVVPVMSVDDDGSLSYFSQRHTRAIAAPGRTIVSTVPDYVGNNNGIADDYASYSGTSMSSPYVAGASVIIREAMDFVGTTNITQDTIYNHMMATADSIFDSATSQWYSRLNMSAAIDALMPVDDFGSTVGSAYNLGTVNADTAFSGVIGKLDDVDFFSFTAGSNGTIAMSVAGTHELLANSTVIGASGTLENNVLSFAVVAGETYTISIETTAGNGIGYYNTSLSFQESIVGPVIVKTAVSQSGLTFTLDSENWLSINGSRLWSNTQDFSIAANQSIVWQGTSGILQRHSASGWETLDTDATKHLVNANSHVFSLGSDNVINIDGAAVWGKTHDFHIADDNAIYWHGVTGQLDKLPSTGSWQSLDTSVSEFAVRHDGVAFALTANGNVTIDGVQTWSNVSDLLVDGTGQLVVVNSDASLHYESGVFSLSSGLALQASQANAQVASVESTTSTFTLDSLDGESYISIASLSTLETHPTGTHDFAAPVEHHLALSASLNARRVIATSLQDDTATITDASEDNPLSARERAYSREDLLDEESSFAFSEQDDAFEGVEAVDFLFERIGGVA